MKRSIQATIKEAAKALKAGVDESVLKWALVMDGWKGPRADQIISWARTFVKSGQGDVYPDPVTITVEPENIS